MDPTDDKANFRGHVPTESSRPIQLGGSVLGPPRHICAFFNSRDDEYRMLLPFIKDGLECGEKAVHTVDRQRRDEHIQRFASAGIDFAAARDGGQLELRTWAMQTCATWHPYEVSTVSLVPDGIYRCLHVRVLPWWGTEGRIGKASISRD